MHMSPALWLTVCSFQARDMQSNADVCVKMTLRVDYYNVALDLWEPIIEPWLFQFAQVCVCSRVLPLSNFMSVVSQKGVVMSVSSHELISATVSQVRRLCQCHPICSIASQTLMKTLSRSARLFALNSDAKVRQLYLFVVTDFFRVQLALVRRLESRHHAAGLRLRRAMQVIKVGPLLDIYDAHFRVVF